MPTTSKRWKDLNREIESLRKYFLPDPFDPLGVYPNSASIQAHARAFLVLSHAEIESYLEEWAKEIAQTAESVWKNKNKITEPLTFLIATLSERITLPDTLTGKNATDIHQRLKDIMVQLFPKYYKRINDNNGIKEKNFLSLFAPLGMPAGALGATLLPDLDNFGERRGTHAHHSAHSAKAVASVLDPETEYKRAIALANDLLVLDLWLLSYKRRIH
jgi:hypothetical protein